VGRQQFGCLTEVQSGGSREWLCNPTNMLGRWYFRLSAPRNGCRQRLGLRCRMCRESATRVRRKADFWLPCECL